MCLPLKEGSLGLKNIKDFNTTLLLKWKLRILEEEEAKLREVLSSRYGNILLLVQTGMASSCNNSKSIWWRDIVNLENRYNSADFLNRCNFIVGNGNTISFWKIAWIKDVTLKFLYPNLNDLSIKKGNSMAEVGSIIHNRWY